MEYRGLNPRQVQESKQRYGSNHLTAKKNRGFIAQFLASFGDPIIKILLAALAVNLLFLIRHFDWVEPAGIAAAIFLATLVSTLSEYGSESAFRRLQQEAQQVMVRVYRNGVAQPIGIGEIVVGDVVMIGAGERIPADGEVTAGTLLVDQSALNGESRETDKHPSPKGFASDLHCSSSVFRGSVVTSGEALMTVRRVGDSTFFGQVARELQEDTRESPLKLRLAGLAKTISVLGYIAAALVAASSVLHTIFIANNFNRATILAALTSPGNLVAHLIQAVTLAVTVVVVAVPEGLPMMITVVLSANMRRMLKDRVLVRKLVGIETSGSLNILFTDKTGTLTKGKLAVTSVVTGDGAAYTHAGELRQTPLFKWIALSGLANTDSMLSGGRVLGGNATDRALLHYLLPISTLPAYEIIEKIPFDSTRKLAAVRLGGNHNVTLMKGAPERLLDGCDRYIRPDGQVVPITTACRTAVSATWHSMTTKAVRALAIVMSENTPTEWEGRFSRLILIGIIGIRDEIRPEAKRAVAMVQGAGVQVVMLTGDNKNTAAAIAADTGVLGSSGSVTTSDELAAMDDAQVRALLPSLRVVARALPSDKTRLVRLAQECGWVTGMTGDGINDAPALKKADVGFAMGSGTEVAKEAGDIVVLDDNIASIAKAILYGRTIFKSIRKFIIFQLTMNLCAVAISVVGPLLGIESPVTVIQMLWINIIMDTLAGLAFAGEPPLREYMAELPKRREEPIINRYMLNQILCTGVYTVGLCLVFLKTGLFRSLFRYDADAVFFMTAFFALFIFCGIFNSFNARTHRVNLLAHIRKNPQFTGIMLCVAVIQILLIYYGGSLFRTAGLTGRELLRILLIAATVVPFDAMRKLMMRLFGRKGGV